MDIQLAKVLKRELKNKGESITGIARSCNIPPSVLHGWTNGVAPSAKNLHHIKALSDYLQVPISVLLFNVSEEKSEDSVLFSSTFVDGNKKYRLTVERLKK